MGGEVAFSCLHLVDSPCQKLPQPHKGVWGEGGGVLAVIGSGCIGGPVLEEHAPSAGPLGPVGSFHEFGGGNFGSW